MIGNSTPKHISTPTVAQVIDAMRAAEVLGSDLSCFPPVPDAAVKP